MTARLRLGLRLTTAGGLARPVGIAVGAGVATLLFLVAAAVPAAIDPPVEGATPEWYATVAGGCAVALGPVLALLITTTRLSSATRDRRLDALRLIGLSRAGAGQVAAVEAGVPAAFGALAGGLTYALGAPVADRAIAAGPRWLAEPLRAEAGLIAAIGAGVVLVAAVLAAAPGFRSPNPLAGRRGARRPPHAARLLVPALGAALLIGAMVVPQFYEAGTALLFSGIVTAGLGIAVGTPVLARAAAAGLVRAGGVVPTLAGRGIQAEPLGASRVVAVLAVALLGVFAGQAVLTMFEEAPQVQSAVRQLGAGPQDLPVSANDGGPVDPNAVRAALAGLPGVLDVAGESSSLELADCRRSAGPDEEPCTGVFVGTCAELAQRIAVSGCDDARAGVITATTIEGTPDGWYAPRVAGPSVALRDTRNGAEWSIPLGPVLEEDSAATRERWTFQGGYSVFVPAHLMPGLVYSGASVVTVGGLDIRAQVRAALAPELGVSDVVEMNDEGVALVARVKAIVTVLVGIVVGTAMLAFLLSSLDQLRERRAVVTRQRMLGMPARTLYAGQLAQVLVPLVGAVALACGLGALIVRAWSDVAAMTGMRFGAGLGLVGLIAGVAALLVCLAVVPLAHVRLTAALLRHE